MPANGYDDRINREKICGSRIFSETIKIVCNATNVSKNHKYVENFNLVSLHYGYSSEIKDLCLMKLYGEMLPNWICI